MAESTEPNVQLSVMEKVNRIKETNEIVALIQKQVLRENEHFGIIPGTSKPTLLKSGAEKLAATFRLDPQYEIKKTEIENGHREYEVVCQIFSSETGNRLGSGAGSCTTMESKYRYRKEAAFEVTDLPIPDDAKERKAEYRAQGYGMQKVMINGKETWRWVKYKESTKIENPDIADTFNTVLKMASKRAFIAAILTVLAVSDMFTQDLEDGLPDPEVILPSEKSNGDGNQDPPPPPPKSQSETKAKAQKDEGDKNGTGRLGYMAKELKAVVESKQTYGDKIKSIDGYRKKWELLQNEIVTDVFKKGMDLLEKATKDAQGVAA